jgi:hypothetical protein
MDTISHHKETFMNKSLILLVCSSWLLVCAYSKAETNTHMQHSVPPFLGVTAKIYQLKPHVSLSDAVADLEASTLKEGRSSPRMLTKTGQPASFSISQQQGQVSLEIQSALDASSYQLTMTWQPTGTGDLQPVSSTLLQTQLDTPVYLLHEIDLKRLLWVLQVSPVMREEDF